MPQYSFTYLFSSDPNNGATNVNATGSSFQIDMSRYPIRMPSKCRNVTASIVSASIPYISPNISVARNNNIFSFNYLGTNYLLTIPNGLYSLSSLQSQISIGLNGLLLPQDIFSFIGNGSTQKVSIVFNYANTYIDFTIANSFNILMGFSNTLVPLIPSTLGQIVTAPNVAEFDLLQAYLIATNLLNNVVPVNGGVSRSIIGVIPITGSPGSRLTYSPSLPIIINANELIDQTRTSADFSILDQQANPIDMLSQIWTILIQFSYEI